LAFEEGGLKATRVSPVASPMIAMRFTSALESAAYAFTRLIAEPTSSAHADQRCCGASRSSMR
jgi:hypothetical protein